MYENKKEAPVALGGDRACENSLHMQGYNTTSLAHRQEFPEEKTNKYENTHVVMPSEDTDSLTEPVADVVLTVDTAEAKRQRAIKLYQTYQPVAANNEADDDINDYPDEEGYETLETQRSFVIDIAAKEFLAKIKEEGRTLKDKTLADNVLTSINNAIRDENKRRSVHNLGKKFTTIDTLPPSVVAQLVNHQFYVKRIASAANTDVDNDPLGIYQDSGKYKGVYRTDITFFRIAAKKFIPDIKDDVLNDFMNDLRCIAPEVKPLADTDVFLDGKMRHGRDLIALKNGIFDYVEKRIYDFTPDIVFLAKIATSFNPFAQNPIIQCNDGTYWDIDSWLTDFMAGKPEMVDLVNKLIGAALRPNVSWNKAVFFYNTSGANGKGTYIALLRHLLGEDNCASIPLSKYEKDYMLTDLVHSIANLVDENNTNNLSKASEDFKAVITHDVILINRKYKAPIKLKWSGINVMCLNAYPKVTDSSQSYFRRQIYVPCRQRYANVERKEIKDDFISRKEVLEYLLFKVLVLLDDYYDLPEPEECKLLSNDIQMDNDPIRMFWSDLRLDFTYVVLPHVFLFDLYKAWQMRNAPSAAFVGRNEFIRQLIEIVDKDGEWEHSGKNGTSYRRVKTSGYFNQPEHLISEYGLTSYFAPGYIGSDLDRKCVWRPRGGYVKGAFLRKGAVDPNDIID